MKQKISVVTSLYRSEKYISEFYSRHLKCLKELQVDYEFIFVDDGSPDNSAQVVKELIKSDANIKLIIFSRNFGQYPAMFAGISNATGDMVYTSDCDLEEAPENIIEFYNTMNKGDIDFVYGVVNERSGGFIKSNLGNLFFNFMRWVSDVNLIKNLSWQLLMTRQYADTLMGYKESETLPGGLMVLAGYNHHEIIIEKTFKGSTSYSLKKRIKLAVNSITAFSSKPLVFIGILGLSITTIAFILLALAVIRKLFFIDYQSGWISIIGSIWLVGGMILSSVGIIGIYLSKMFNQVKQRPLYIIKSIISK